jgi:hypothetical protein
MVVQLTLDGPTLVNIFTTDHEQKAILQMRLTFSSCRIANTAKERFVNISGAA